MAHFLGNRCQYPYWTVPDRQIETSVVLADTTWRTLNPQ
jgi:hypothetical protein